MQALAQPSFLLFLLCLISVQASDPLQASASLQATVPLQASEPMQAANPLQATASPQASPLLQASSLLHTSAAEQLQASAITQLQAPATDSMQASAATQQFLSCSNGIDSPGSRQRLWNTSGSDDIDSVPRVADIFATAGELHVILNVKLTACAQCGKVKWDRLSWWFQFDSGMLLAPQPKRDPHGHTLIVSCKLPLGGDTGGPGRRVRTLSSSRRRLGAVQTRPVSKNGDGAPQRQHHDSPVGRDLDRPVRVTIFAVDPTSNHTTASFKDLAFCRYPVQAFSHSAFPPITSRDGDSQTREPSRGADVAAAEEDHTNTSAENHVSNTFSAPSGDPSADSSEQLGHPQFRYELGACTSVAGSHLFRVPEWIVYHLQQGWEHFYVYVNEDPAAARVLLAPFITAGIVTVIDFESLPGSRAFSQQQAAQNSCLMRYRGVARWVAMTDVDEFFQPMQQGTTVASFLSTQIDENPETQKFSGLCFLSYRFGMSGYSDTEVITAASNFLELSSSGLVLALSRFVFRAGEPDMTHLKNIVQPLHVTYYSVHKVTLGLPTRDVDAKGAVRIVHYKTPAFSKHHVLDTSMCEHTSAVVDSMARFGYTGNYSIPSDAWSKVFRTVEVT